MSPTGDADLLVAARSALLDALEALHAHRDAVIVIGAQAIYLHTGADLSTRTPTTSIACSALSLPVASRRPCCSSFRTNWRGW